MDYLDIFVLTQMLFTLQLSHPQCLCLTTRWQTRLFCDLLLFCRVIKNEAYIPVWARRFLICPLFPTCSVSSGLLPQINHQVNKIYKPLNLVKQAAVLAALSITAQKSRDSLNERQRCRILQPT